MTNKQIISIILVGLVLVTTVVAADTFNGNGNGSYNGNQNGNFSGTATSSWQEVKESVIFANTLSTSHNSASGQQVDFSPFNIYDIDSSQSKTRFRLDFVWALAPTGISGASITSTISIDNQSQLNCIASTSLPSGAARQNYGGSLRCTADSYLSGNHWLYISGSRSNAVSDHYSIEIYQTEVVNITRTYTLSGTTTGSHSGTGTNTFSGNTSGNGTSGGNLTLTDHNVTIIEGDENVPIMRVYGWIVGIVAFLIILAEWKKDAMYYLFATISLIYATITFPTFLPGELRFVPIVLALYSAYRIATVILNNREITRQEM